MCYGAICILVTVEQIASLVLQTLYTGPYADKSREMSVCSPIIARVCVSGM